MNKEGYKKTELGYLPLDWDVKKLGEITNNVTIGLVKTMTAHYCEQGVPLIRNSNIKEDKIDKENMVFLTYEFAEANENKRLKVGDIVTVHTGDIGTSAVIEKDMDGAHGFATLNTTVNPEIIYNYYLSKYFNSNMYKKQAMSFSTGDGRFNLNLKDFVNSLIPIPPLKEQKKIAEILSSVDAAIEKTEQVIAKTEEVKKGLMQQLLTKGIGHTEFVDTELGSLPSKWTVMNFMSLVNILDFRGRTPKKLGLDWGGNIPALSANNVRMGYIDFSLPTHYGNDTLYEKWMTKGDLEIGDLVLTTEAPAGNIAIINKNERYILSQRVIGIKVYREYLLPEYLKYYFMSDLFNKYLKQFSTGTTVTGISQKSLAFLKIPLPSLEEQEKISRTLLQYDSKLLNDNQYLKELKNLKSGLMQQLLTGQVRVKVD